MISRRSGEGKQEAGSNETEPATGITLPASGGRGHSGHPHEIATGEYSDSGSKGAPRWVVFTVMYIVVSISCMGMLGLLMGSWPVAICSIWVLGLVGMVMFGAFFFAG